MRDYEPIKADLAATKDDIAHAAKHVRRERTIIYVLLGAAITIVAVASVMVVLSLLGDASPSRQDYQDRYVQLLLEHTDAGPDVCFCSAHAVCSPSVLSP